jgi:ribosomal protein S1
MSVEVQLIEKKLQKNKPRITVSRKRLLETPFALFAKSHKIGQTIEGDRHQQAALWVDC